MKTTQEITFKWEANVSQNKKKMFSCTYTNVISLPETYNQRNCLQDTVA